MQMEQSIQTKQVDIAELILLYLEQLGIEYIFGVAGGAIEPLYNALARRSRVGGIRSVMACHEAGAAFMADGYARESGKIGVCIATSGPGATNLITGISSAFENKIPILAISGQPALPNFGKGALQESSCTGLNIMTMMEACTRYNSLISHASQLESKLVSALLTTKQAINGPSHLSIPVDIQRQPAKCLRPTFNIENLMERSKNLVDEDAIESLYEEIKQSTRPIFLIGTGCGGAIESILKLVELSHAFFLTTPDAKGLINPDHTGFRGVFGFGGHHISSELMENSEQIIVAFGLGFEEFSSGGWSTSLLNERLIHVDGIEENFNRSPIAKLHVLGDIKHVCDKVNYLIAKEQKSKFKFGQTHSPKNFTSFLNVDTIAKMQSPEKPLKPQRVMSELSRLFPAGTRFFADAGNSMVWAPHLLQAKNRRYTPERREPRPGQVDRRKGNGSWLRVNENFGCMSWAIGAVVGATIVDKSRLSVCITGDGSFLMSGKEILTAKTENLPIVYVIMNDGIYGMVMHGQRIAKAEPIAYQLPSVNYKKMAESMGIEAYTIAEPEDFNILNIDTILKNKKPVLLDILIDQEEVPPMKLRLNTLGSVNNQE